jgi:hypothetical protein
MPSLVSLFRLAGLCDPIQRDPHNSRIAYIAPRARQHKPGGASHVLTHCWEIIADNLYKAGWSLGWVSAVDSDGRTIWIVDAHGYGKRFILRADEKLPAFVELESAIHGRTLLH